MLPWMRLRGRDAARRAVAGVPGRPADGAPLTRRERRAWRRLRARMYLPAAPGPLEDTGDFEAADGEL